MAESDIKLPFALDSWNRMVSIADVVRGLACDCFCPQCKGTVVAVKGDIVRHHFRHHIEGDCYGAFETGLHLFAKQIVCEMPALLALPGGTDLGAPIAATAELSLGDIRPDVLVEYTSENVAVEIFVTHRVDREKVAKYSELGHTAIEIDLSCHRYVSLEKTSDRTWIENLILHQADRYWLIEPAAVREEKRRQREALLKEEIRQRKVARQEVMAAEQARKVEQERLATQMAAEDRLQVEQRLREIEENERQAREREAQEIEKAKERDRVARLKQALEAHAYRQAAPPDLQALVLAHDTWADVPEEAWRDHYAKTEAWREGLRAGDRYLSIYLER